MAYFDCIVGGSGKGNTLVVTCADDFAGATITCTNGTKTYRKTCPSSSPYVVKFNGLVDDTWDISGTIGGTTYTESILIQDYSVELKTVIDLTVDFYSAANDTVSYTGIDSQTHAITTDSNGHAVATIRVNGAGSSLTFTSSVAKNPSNIAQAYSKVITISSNTTEIFVMPSNVIYWFGYKSSIFQEGSPTNGWTYNIYYNWSAMTYNTNSIDTGNVSNNYVNGIASKNQVSITKVKCIVKKSGSNGGGFIGIASTKNLMALDYGAVEATGTAMYAVEVNATGSPGYVCTFANYTRGTTIYALWYE